MRALIAPPCALALLAAGIERGVDELKK